MDDVTTTLPGNLTMVDALAEWGVGEEPLLTTMWVVQGLLVLSFLLTCSAHCWVNTWASTLATLMSGTLAMVQALLLSCFVDMPFHVVQGLAVLTAAGVLWSSCLAAMFAMQNVGKAEEEVVNFACVPCDQDGKDYAHDYVGCDMCGKLLSREHFFSCMKCSSASKGYELCAKCVLQHPEGHTVLQYKRGVVAGRVDLRAPMPPPDLHDAIPAHLRPLVTGS
mmetsp:Transcript_81031/g.262547  ORF Transcript_81031/g.262547 Transcript_81031/m.262547 type:complete len:222 (+) Transcript_81031:141-806(+)